MVHFIFKDARKIRDEAHVARMTSLAFGCALVFSSVGFQQGCSARLPSKAARLPPAPPQPGDAISRASPAQPGLWLPGTSRDREVRAAAARGGGRDGELSPSLPPPPSPHSPRRPPLLEPDRGEQPRPGLTLCVLPSEPASQPLGGLRRKWCSLSG